MDGTENDTSNNSFIVRCVFVDAATFLLSRRQATIGGTLIEEFMKYAAEMGSGAMIYMPSVLNTESDIRILRRNLQTDIL
jgi:hypothetical protein